MLSCRLGRLALRSPLLTASGTFGHDGAALAFLDPADLGALVLKTVTPAPRPGNPPPRLHETPAGLLNSIGLENRGLAAFLSENRPALAAAPAPVVANAGGESVAEYREVVAAFAAEPWTAAIELNLSCPNVQGGRLPFSSSPEAVAEVVAACRPLCRQPLWAKLSPNAGRIGPFARAAEEAGADAVTVANTILGLAVDWRRQRPVLGAGYGGLSGPAVRPIALRLVHEAAAAVSIPVIGCGGIAEAEDVLEFLVAGASAVQVGTACFREPGRISRLAADLRRLLAAEGLRVSDLVGTLEWPDR